MPRGPKVAPMSDASPTPAEDTREKIKVKTPEGEIIEVLKSKYDLCKGWYDDRGFKAQS